MFKWHQCLQYDACVWQNEGVKVYVLVWKEIPGVVTTFSAYAKQHLTQLNSNIQVLRHPDFAPGTCPHALLCAEIATSKNDAV